MEFKYLARRDAFEAMATRGVRAIDVSSYSATHAFLSPYTWSRDFAIPVPGLADTVAHSVEGVWQGLKIVDGRIDERLFTMRPRKRRGQVEGHLLEGRAVDIVEARRSIYIPTYFHYLESYVDAEVFDDFLATQLGGTQVYFFDTESNGDIRVDEPLMHAAVLATFMNFLLWESIPEKDRRPPYAGREEAGALVDELEPPGFDDL